MTENKTLRARHEDAVSCFKRANRFRDQMRLNRYVVERGAVRLGANELDYVPDFKYLGRIFTQKDSDMTTFFRSIRQATVRWHMLGRLLRQPQLKKPSKRHLISVIIHSALLFGSESWIFDNHKLRFMRTFQQRILRSVFSIKGHVVNTVYHLPSREHVLRTADVEDVGQIVRRRRLAFYIRTLARSDAAIPLRRLISAFETPGAETHQRHDGNRAWWTTQLRHDAINARLPQSVYCVSHWVGNAKKHIFVF